MIYDLTWYKVLSIFIDKKTSLLPSLEQESKSRIIIWMY